MIIYGITFYWSYHQCITFSRSCQKYAWNFRPHVNLYLIHQAIKMSSSEQDSYPSFILHPSLRCRHNSFKGLLFHKRNRVLSRTFTFGNFTDIYGTEMKDTS
jgi:hypothetical protein